MKTKIATALSLVGVLGAGSAAAMVNTQILDSGPAGADTSAILTPAPQQVSTTAASTSSSSTTAVTTTTIPTTTIAPVVITPAPAAAPAASPFLTTYDLGASGMVTVDVVNGATTLVTATPNAGWAVASSETDPSQNKIEVKLSDGVTVVELEVRFDGVQLLPEVSSSLVTANTTANPTGNTTANTTGNTTTRNTVDDDDDDTENTIDDDDDDDHDDDHGGDRDDDDDDD